MTGKTQKTGKILLIFGASFLVLVLISVLLVKPVIILCVKAQIKKAVGAQRVLVGDCHLEFFHDIHFYEVQINKQKDFDFTAKEASVRFNPWLLMAGASPDQFVEELHLSNIAARSKPSNFVLENGTLTVSPKIPGVLLIDRIQWGKLSVYKIKSIVYMENKKLFFKSLKGQVLNGLINGDINVTMEKSPEYAARLNFKDIDLTHFVIAVNLNKKAAIQGLLSGNLVLKGRDKQIQVLKGDFFSGRQGGSVIIKDIESLKHFAVQSHQSSDLIIESLKNYHYNTGDINISMRQGVMLLEIHLNGETGKRNFQIRLHDFL